MPKAEQKKDKKTATPGVRAGRTRGYVAGQLIKKNGLDAGVTPELIAELNAEYGKPSDEMSEWLLKAAWHALRGYLGEANK